MLNIRHGNGLSTGKARQTFVKYPDNIKENSVGDIIQIHSGNSNASVELTYNYYEYTLTDEQKAAVGSLATGRYWLASPCMTCTSYSATYDLHAMNSGSVDTRQFF